MLVAAVISKTSLAGVSQVPEPGRVNAGHSWPVPRFHIVLPTLIHGASMNYLIVLSKALLLASWLHRCMCCHPECLQVGHPAEQRRHIFLLL